ncbi:SRPBCC family protein [Archangium lansingense]|uniref:SRPBCC family protein n=1 Tax=Archangium lansingense TaxID=2995310 RepID=UPI003B7651FE
MLKKILIAFATLVGLLLVIGFALPSKFRVERSTIIQAPPEVIYGHVANLERWQEWGPWSAKKYPGSNWTYGGPQVGVGAVHSWSGGSVGNGTLSLTQADPKTGVVYDMSVEHGRYLLHGSISFTPEGQGTRVTWVDEGDVGASPLAHYLVPLIRSRLGRYLEEGLANLGKQVEASFSPLVAEPEPTPEPVPVEQAEAPAQPSTPAPSAPPPAEGAQAGAPTVEGSPVTGSPAVPPAEVAHAPDAGEVAPPVVVPPAPEGEAAPSSPGTTAPSGEPTPAEASPTVPASTPAPAPASSEGQAASPT